MKKFLLLIALFSASYSLADTQAPSTPYGLEVLHSEYKNFTLAWIGSGDDDREGQAAAYELVYSLNPMKKDSTMNEGRVLSFKTLSGKKDKFIKALLDIKVFDLKGFLTVRAIDEAGNFSLASESIAFEVVSPLSGSNFTDYIDEAVVAGDKGDGRRLLACVALIGSNQVPGVSYEGLDGCYTSHQAKRKAYKPFRYIRARPELTWKKGKQKNFPKNALKLGTYYGNPVFSCRAQKKDGTMASGTLRMLTATMYSQCSISLDDSSERFKSFEVLVKSE